MADVNEIVSKEAIQGIKDIDKYIISADGSLQKLIASAKNFNTSFSKATGTVDQVNAAQKKLTDNTNILTKAQKDANSAAASLSRQKQAGLAIIAKEEAALRGDLGAYKKLNAEVANAKKIYLETAAAQGVNSRAAKEAKVSHDKLNKTLTDLNRSAGVYSPEVGKYGQMWDSVKGNLLSVAGALGIATGAMAIGKGIIEATDAVSDKFEETLGGVKNGFHYVAVALTTMDFSNFMSNLKDAIKAGKEYVAALDEIGDRTRARGIIDSQTAKRRAELDVASNNVNLSITERKKALDELLSIEKTNADMRLDLAKSNEAAELKYAANQTGLSQKRIKELLIENETNKDAVRQAKEYLNAISTLSEANAQKSTAGGALKSLFGSNNDLKEAENIIKKTPENIKATAKELFSLGKINEDRYTSISEAVKNVGNEEASYYEENNKRLTRQNKLLKGEDDATIKVTASIEKKAKAIKKTVDLLAVSEGTNAEYAQTQYIIAENEARRIATELIEKETDALLELGDAQYSAQYAKNIENKTGKALGALPKHTLGQQFSALSKEDKKGMAIDAAQQTSDAAFAIIANSANAEFDLKMGLLEKEKDEKLKNTKLTEAQKAKIEEEYRKKEAKLKTDAAKKEKAAAIIQAIISGVLAVLKAGGLTNPLGIAASISAAAQVAVIAATPIPKFDKGTLYSPDTFIAGEKRPEFLKAPSGKLQFVDKPTLFQGMAGSTVISGEDTERIMKVAGRDAIMGFNFAPLAEKMDILNNTMKNKTEFHISGTTGKITERQGDYYKEYFNRKFKC